MKLAQNIPLALRLVAFLNQANLKPRSFTHSGIHFPNDVGLAAGFDKNGEVPLFMQALGFGFAEIGTVVPRLQVGNDRPRMFRIPDRRAIINRMGFNSHGAWAVAKNLRPVKDRLKIPIGISVGRNKDTAAQSAEAAMINDCIDALDYLWEYADYSVANFSSPNTKDLRKLQAADSARQIVKALLAYGRNRGSKPLLIKLACDMEREDVVQTVEACRKEGVTGFITSNTTLDRMQVSRLSHGHEMGGLSGPPLHQRAVAMVQLLRKIDSEMLIIGVGGIESREDADRMRDAGADLIQVLTGFIYQGPGLVREISG